MPDVTVVKGKLTTDVKLSTYAGLRERVRRTLILGQRKIEEIKTKACWQVGRLIRMHILRSGDRADYGKEVIGRLARDLGVSDEILYKAKRLYEAYPISTPAWKLTIRHYLALARISDKKKRLQLTVKAEKEGWITDKLEKEVRLIVKNRSKTGSNGEAVSKRALLEAKKGKLGIYRLIERQGKLHVDLGFTSYVELDKAQAKNFKQGDIVSFNARGRLKKVEGANSSDLYTYKAEIERVVDADTVWMRIWVKRPMWVNEKLRLRGIDAPELDTARGKAAKRFVESLVAKASSVTITTTKPDKWDRYLTDAFLTMKDGSEIFLNNFLLEKGYAVPKNKFSLLDWEG